jgi:hypothetical protein
MGELSEQNRALMERVRLPGEYSIFPAWIGRLLDAARSEGIEAERAYPQAARSEAQPSGYDGLRQALAEAIEFAEQDWQALTPEGDAMLDRWRAALTFTASLSDASPKPSSDEQET